MQRNLPELATFTAGLAAVCWIAAGYVPGHPLALLFTLLVLAFYLLGALELYRYRQATASLEHALAGLDTPPGTLADWLAQLHPTLRAPVSARIEGGRTPLPGPALVPYLVGLLVLLGMLGTLLGMMTTLRGTGIALQGTGELEAIREALAAPVRGLGFAFGTSIAGVAASAALGLLSALCRGGRAGAAAQLDARTATVLRPWSQVHRREQTFRLLERQADLLPVLVARLEAMAGALERQGIATSERQLAAQETFHERAAARFDQLAGAVQASLAQSVAASAREAGAAVRPVLESTLAAIAGHAEATGHSVNAAVQRHLDGSGERLRAIGEEMAGQWNRALEAQREAGAVLLQDLRSGQQQLAVAMESHAAALVERVGARLEQAGQTVTAGWHQAARAQQEDSRHAIETQRQAMAEAAAAAGEQAARLLEALQQAHDALQERLASQEQARLARWNATLQESGEALRQAWEQAGDGAAQRQQAVCDALASTAADISDRTRAQAEATIAEISQLARTAAEAPRAAAEVITEVRRQLSDSLARDTALLEERSRHMAMFGELLEGVNRASGEQRAALESLVESTTALLERTGTQFGEQVQAGTARLEHAGTEVAVGATEVAGLAEAFGEGVAAFAEGNALLVERMRQLEAALEKSAARSDEQLAYYVAQAREVIDLGMLSQKQIVEDLHRLSSRGAGA